MVKEEIKLIALDMDGTVLNERGEISQQNADAIREAETQGVKVIFSTGRTKMTSSDYAASLNLSSYLITVNGSEIWDHKGELVERQLIHTDVMQWMWELSREHAVPFWAVSCDKVWDNDMPADINSSEWMKCRFEIEEQALREEIMKQLQARGGLEISNSSPTNLEVNLLGVNKAIAIEKVCSHLDLSMNQVMSVGDSLNDLAMIKAAGLGIAMGNAQEAVKREADWITETNTNHGVAVAINKWVLS